jgi:predicted nucleic acid-binding protein
MISSNCDFSDFVAFTKDKSYQDIIYLADQEATAAERLLYRNAVNNAERKKCGQEYATILKDLIVFMRCHIRPKKKENDFFELFELVLDGANAEERTI